MKIGYCKQTFKYPISLQMEQLDNANCDKIYINQKTNKYNILDLLQTNDILVITRFIILAENLQELLQLLNNLQQKGITIIVIEHNYLSSKHIFLPEILQSLIEFLNDIKYQRQTLGIVKAKAKGKKLGRKRKLSTNKLIQALDMKQYYTNQQIANKFNVSRSTLLRNLAEYNKSC